MTRATPALPRPPEEAVDTMVPVLVDVSTPQPAGLAPPLVHAELAALGTHLRLPVVDAGDHALLQGQLPAPPRHLRLRLWCAHEAGPALCGDLVHTPASTDAVRLSLVLEPDPAGHWQLLQRDPALPLPLGLQVLPGLLLGLGILVHWHRRER